MSSLSKESAKFLAIPSLLAPAVTVNVSSKVISMGGESMAITKSTSQDSMIQAIDAFLKNNIDMGKMLVRKATFDKNVTNSPSILKNQSMLTVRKGEGNKELSYTKVKIEKGRRLKIKSCYLGKRGDVIFTFNTPGYPSSEQIEIKLDDAVHLLEGFSGDIEYIFADKIKETAAHYQELADKKALEEKKIAAAKIQEKIDLKAAMYANRPAFGAW